MNFSLQFSLFSNLYTFKYNVFVSSQPYIPTEFLNKCKEDIEQLIEKEKVGPIEHLKIFDKYENFIIELESNKVEEFKKLDTSENFDKYHDLIDYYDRLSRDVTIEYTETYYVGFFILRRKDIVKYISMMAQKFKNMLVTKMISEYQQKSRA